MENKYNSQNSNIENIKGFLNAFISNAIKTDVKYLKSFVNNCNKIHSYYNRNHANFYQLFKNELRSNILQLSNEAKLSYYQFLKNDFELIEIYINWYLSNKSEIDILESHELNSYKQIFILCNEIKKEIEILNTTNSDNKPNIKTKKPTPEKPLSFTWTNKDFNKVTNLFNELKRRGFIDGDLCNFKAIFSNGIKEPSINWIGDGGQTELLYLMYELFENFKYVEKPKQLYKILKNCFLIQNEKIKDTSLRQLYFDISKGNRPATEKEILGILKKI